ncbi:MAG: TlpA disulfide reductase family protein [Nitriliruptoraceae bacterium]
MSSPTSLLGSDRMVIRPLMVGLLAVAVIAVACSAQESLRAGPADAEPPPRDAVLADGGWDEAAAWIYRENSFGRPVLVNVFASWCIPCRREMPLLLEAFDANDDIAFLGIDHLDQRDNAERFIDEMGIRFPTIYDVTGDFALTIEARGMPTTVVFDLNGEIAGHRTGELTRTSLEELLDKIR